MQVAGRLSCEKGGEEFAPQLVALDLVSGEVSWVHCGDEATFGMIVGRAQGVTLVWQAPDNGQGSELVAFDDSGDVLWRRAGDEQQPERIVGDDVVIEHSFPDDTVAAFAVATGEERWSYPGSGARLLGVRNGVVVLFAGGPGQPPAPPAEYEIGQATLRAIDARTGEQRWTREVAAVAARGWITQPTLGDHAIAVPASPDETVIFDVVSGEELSRVPGVFNAVSNCMSERPMNTAEIVWRELGSGEEIPELAGFSPARATPDLDHPLGAGQCLAIGPTPVPNLSQLVLYDGEADRIVWRSEGAAYLSAWSPEHVGVLIDGGVAMLDGDTATERWRVNLDSPDLDIGHLVIGDAVVLVRTNFPGTG